MNATHRWLVASAALLAASCTSDRVSGVIEDAPRDPAGLTAEPASDRASDPAPEPADEPTPEPAPAPEPDAEPATPPGANVPPSVWIDFPCEGFILYEGRGIYFGGRATDEEDGDLPCSTFLWSFDGQALPSPGQWNQSPDMCRYGGWMDDIERGSHVLTLSAADSRGARASASITITAVEFRDASFTDDVLSFFGSYCTSCHGAERAAAGIRLDSYEAIVTGGNAHGPLIVEGDPTGGILIPQILSDHFYVDGYGLHVSEWMGETILPVWILEGARNTDHPHPVHPVSCRWGDF